MNDEGKVAQASINGSWTWAAPETEVTKDHLMAEVSCTLLTITENEVAQESTYGHVKSSWDREAIKLLLKVAIFLLKGR